MNAHLDQSAVLDRAQCLTLMSSVPIGRVVYTDRALPAVTPVNFIVDGDAVIIHTGSNHALAAALRGTVVAFEVDRIDSDTLDGWWVSVTGCAQLLTSPADLAHAAELSLRPWVRLSNAHFIRIKCRHIAGGRFDLSASARAVDEAHAQT